jgi:hypothetical protein
MPESIRRMIGGLRFSYCSEYPKSEKDLPSVPYHIAT